jgi:hypothetical protein
MSDSETFARMLGKTVDSALMPVVCSVHQKTYQFDRPGLPHIHEQYFCEHIWWCNACVMWCYPGRQRCHPETIPLWGVIVKKEQP